MARGTVPPKATQLSQLLLLLRRLASPDQRSPLPSAMPVVVSLKPPVAAAAYCGP